MTPFLYQKNMTRNRAKHSSNYCAILFIFLVQQGVEYQEKENIVLLGFLYFHEIISYQGNTALLQFSTHLQKCTGKVVISSKIDIFEAASSFPEVILLKDILEASLVVEMIQAEDNMFFHPCLIIFQIFLSVALETCGNFLLFSIIIYEKYGMDSKKRTATNQLMSSICGVLIFSNVCVMPVFMLSRLARIKGKKFA